MDEADATSQIKLSDLGCDMPATVSEKPWLWRENRFMSGTGLMSLYEPWKPANSYYISFKNRVRSFDTWPIQMSPTGFELAKSGFYYTGVSDSVKCFCCDLPLHKWEKKDSALVEHQTRSPECRFLLMTQLM